MAGSQALVQCQVSLLHQARIHSVVKLVACHVTGLSTCDLRQANTADDLARRAGIDAVTSLLHGGVIVPCMVISETMLEHAAVTSVAVERAMIIVNAVLPVEEQAPCVKTSHCHRQVRSTSSSTATWATT